MARQTYRPSYGRLDVTPTEKRVRARLGPSFVVDTTDAALLVVGHPRAYLVPEGDVDHSAVGRPSEVEEHEVYGRIRRASLTVGEHEAKDAIIVFEDDDTRGFDPGGRVLVDWNAMDGWFEEEEEVYVHPQDPYHRVDTRLSSRHVEIVVDGQTVADTRRPVLLFETGLPVRYYVPQTDVRLDLLVPSDKETACPYKGFADYHHVDTGRRHKDLVWRYRAPFDEARKIQGLFAFYNERVDMTVDGRELERPKTPFGP